jgi:hypothetical protein
MVIEDISSIRFSKINKILESIGPEHIVLNLNNITSKELETIRPFIVEAFGNKLDILNVGGGDSNLGNNVLSSYMNSQTQSFI